MKKIMLLPMLALTLAGCNKNVKTVDADEFARIIDEGEAVLIDVRTAAEYTEGHIPGALNIDVKQDGFADHVDVEGPVAVYCKAGRRSKAAAAMLTDKGYFVYNLDGGFQAWQAAGKPVE